MINAFIIIAATCVAAEIQLDTNGNYTVEAGNAISPGAGVDVNTVVKFECDPGYELYGSLRSYCQHSGWSDPKPECHRESIYVLQFVHII